MVSLLVAAPLTAPGLTERRVVPGAVIAQTRAISTLRGRLDELKRRMGRD